MRLGQKITFASAAFGLVLVATFSVAGNFYVSGLVRHDFDNRSRLLEQLVVHSISEALLNEDRLTAGIALSSIAGSVPELAYLVVSDADRRVVIKAGPSADRFADVIAENSLENGGVFLEHQEGFVVMVGRKFFDADHRLLDGRYSLHTGLTTELVDDAYRSFLATTLIVDVMIALGVLFIILYSRRTVLSPIVELGRRTREISQGKFETALPAASKDEVGDLVRDFSVMAGDLKEMRQGLEEKVRTRTKNLEETKEQYRQLFETAPLCVKIIDRQGKVILMNRTGREEHFIKDDAELERWDWLESIDSKFRPKAKERIKKALAGEFGQIEIKHTPSGSKREWCLSFFVPINGDDGKVKQILAYSLDVSDRKTSEAKVKDLNELRVKFIQIISHQLRTPLNAIRWNLEALLGEEMGRLRPEQKEFVRLTHDADVEVIRRIHDLLTATDIEEGRAILEKELISLESLWSSAVAGFTARVKTKNLICKFTPSKTPLPEIEIDTEKIRQVFGALLDNAVSYTSEGGRIGISFSMDKENVRFEISDTGIGIPKAEQRRIFTRFFRASNASTMKPDASGLGLSIAKYYVEQHGGKMGFESTEGKGSTFWFKIPSA